jgi:hypothetical protein
LVISVFLRDYYYIERHGLAYKRIGVLFFLLMVLIGLTTVFVKIWYKKSTYFLFRVNAWAGIIVLVISTTLHWDEFIANYNLQRKGTVSLDIGFLLSLSDKTLPLLENNKDVLRMRQEIDEQGVRVRDKKDCDTCYLERLRTKESRFFKQQEQFSWLSWNYADAYTKKYFREKRMTTRLSNK